MQQAGGVQLTGRLIRQIHGWPMDHEQTVGELMDEMGENLDVHRAALFACDAFEHAVFGRTTEATPDTPLDTIVAVTRAWGHRWIGDIERTARVPNWLGRGPAAAESLLDELLAERDFATLADNALDVAARRVFEETKRAVFKARSEYTSDRPFDVSRVVRQMIGATLTRRGHPEEAYATAFDDAGDFPFDWVPSLLARASEAERRWQRIVFAQQFTPARNSLRRFTH